MNSLGDLSQFLSDIFFSSPDAMFIKDENFRYRHVNRAHCASLGRVESEIIGRDDFELIDLKNLSLVETAKVCRANDEKVIRELKAHAHPLASEESYVTPETTYSYNVHRQVVEDENGKRFIFAQVRNTTELHRSESLRKETEKRFDDFLDLIDEVVWSAEWPSGEITYASPYLERVYGLTLDHFRKNEDWLKIYSPSELGRLSKMMSSAVEERRPQFSGEFSFTHPTKGQRMAFVRGRIFRNEDGEAVRIDGMISDITALQQAKAELQEQREKIFALSKLNTLGELASGIGHEINTPLTSILSKIARVENKLNEVDADPTSIRLLRESMSLVERISEIVDGLKRLSRNDSSEEIESFSPQLALEQALSLSRARFSNHGIRLSVQNFLPVDQRILGKPTSLFQALVNLLNNSFDALESNANGGLVQIELEASGAFVLLRVIDNGTGISDNFRPHLFQAFQTTKPEGKGTGLGLSISRRLLRTMKGDLRLVPRDDGLTAFEMTLVAAPHPSL